LEFKQTDKEENTITNQSLQTRT